MNQLDEAIQVLGGDRFVLLIEVVDVAIEDLDEEFNGYSSVHAGVCDTESPLETFENALAIAVELGIMLDTLFFTTTDGRLVGRVEHTFFASSSPRCGFSTTHQRWLARYTARH